MIIRLNVFFSNKKEEAFYILQQRGARYHRMGSMRRLKAGPVAPMRMRGGGFRGRGGKDHSRMSQTLLSSNVILLEWTPRHVSLHVCHQTYYTMAQQSESET